MKTRSAWALRGAAISSLLIAIAHTAEACSLAAPWGINDPLMIAFLGSPLADTVVAGNGLRTPVVAMGHSGSGAPRTAFGQRVRVDRLGDRARRALPRDTREVVLVPWDYAADCRPVAWGRSARWLPDSLRGLFRARLRPQAQWAQGVPTFDVTGTQFQPYRDIAEGTNTVDGVYSRAPRLSARSLLLFYDGLPPQARDPDTLAAMQWMARVKADTTLAGRYPVTEFVYLARTQFATARARAVRVPVAGTFRLNVTLDTLPPRTLFLRVAATVSSMQGSMRGIPDTARVPRVPEGYYVSATAAVTLEGLAATCHMFDRATIAYVDLDWHGPMPADGIGEWKGGIDARLFNALFSADELDRWQARRRAASAERADSLRALPDSIRARVRDAPFIFIPNRPLRVIQEAGRPMRIEGAMILPLMGELQIRGERFSRDSLPCFD
ncbi:hypothetical protein [Gemmatimonas sp.]|uniref:hypothetical protein n=1 Tax=Gemmatimonas sp. TaxID=1962908 RepID=UPI00398322EB